MRKTLLMLLAIMLSISGWSVNYTVSISTSDSEAGYVAVDISGDGDVNDETYHDTDENGNYTEFEVAKNRQITLTPVLNDDVLYYFAGWSDGKTDYPRTIKVTKDWDLTAVFEAYPTYVITAVADPLEAVNYVYTDANNYIDGGSDWVEVMEGETVTLSFDEITAGYQFVGWYDGDELISTNSDYSVQATASKTYTAKFEEIPTYTILVVADPTKGGDIDTWPNDNDNLIDEEEQYDSENQWENWITVRENTEVVIYAAAMDGYRFLGWYDGETQVYGPEYNGQNISFTLTENKTYTAKFEEIVITNYTMRVVADPIEGGDIDTWTKNGNDPVIGEGWDGNNYWITVRENTEIEIYAEARDGYRFLGWYDGETQVYGPEYDGQYIYFTLNEDKTYTAKFEAIPTYTVRVVADPIEGGDVSTWIKNDKDPIIDRGWEYDWITVRENTEIYIWTEARDGYRFLGWYDGETQVYGPEYNGQYIYFTLNEDKTYTAKFEAIPTYTVRVVADPIEGGDVDTWTEKGSVIDYGGYGNNDYWITVSENTAIYIWAEARDGYRFLGWYDGETQVYGPAYNGQYIYFTPTEDKTYTAKFEAIPTYTVHLDVNDVELGYVWTEYNTYFDTDENNGQVTIEGVREGTTLTLNAVVNDGYFIDFLGWSDGTTNSANTIMVDKNINLTANFKEKEHPTPEAGYTQLGNSKLYYAVLENSIDIHGLYNRQYYESTSGSIGYQAAIKVGDNSAQMIPGSGMASYNGVQVETSIQQQSKYARVIYKVTNTGNAAKTVSLGAYSDVKIGNNDSAPIKTRSVGGNVFGLTMDDGKGAQFCVLFGAGISGVAPVSDFWFGSYYQNRDAEQIVGDYTGEGDNNYMVENGSYDSGMGWCWKNRTVGAGETMVFSYLIAVGDISLEPNSNITVTPNDMSKWNDLSAVHSLFVEGTYEGVLNGTVEYRVEDSEEWLTLAENVASSEVFYNSINVQFDATKQTHLLHFRTRDIMGNISGESTFAYLDISSYGVTGGIEDKVYTGEPIEQTGLTSDLADETLYQYTYLNNVNAGTATLYFEGVFPNSIGRKVYTFNITPATLTGTIIPTYTEYVYTGSEINMGWEFSNNAYHYGNHQLSAGKDYTVTYTNNTLPGTATITVTGKGNYTGTLTTTFEILKMPFDETLYSITLPDENILYDGNIHEATVELLADNMGTASVVYINRETGTETVPVAKGVYDVFVHVTDGALYYGTDGNLYAGTFTIYEIDDDEWTALQNIYNELITRGWLHPWDMSKGKAGVSGFAGVTITMGHVTGLDLSENGLTGTFPTSVLYLPYLETLGLYGNHLSGAIESGMDAYAAWATEQGEDDTETIDVYVQKPTSWSSAGIWAWTGYNNTLVNLFDEWPGVEMTETTNGWWKYSGLPKGVSVVINDGSYSGEQSRDIPDNGHGGGLQSDTWIVLTNEMVTTSGIGHGYEANWWSEPVKGIRHINIANNEFTGNIGAFASYFPHLNTLQAQHNHIEEVMPMISPDVTSLNLNNQTITTQRTIDLTQPQTMSGLLQLLPRVILYKHAQQTYQLSGAIKVVNSLTEPTWNANITIGSDNQVTFTSATGNEFPFGTEDVLYAVESTTGMSFPVNVLFNAGDANFDCAVDVLDLQAIINHIFGKHYQNRPFNITAANLYPDDVINIQDLIMHINLLLQEKEGEPVAGRRIAAEEEDEMEAQAVLTWQNGELHLMSEQPVAALDLTVIADGEIEWLVNTHTVRSTDSGNRHKAVMYSLGGKTLPAGTDVLLARCSDTDAQTVKATLSDPQAEYITARMQTIHAGLPTAVDNVEMTGVTLTIVDRTVILTTDEPLHNANWMLYDFTGKTIAGGTVSTTGDKCQLTYGIPTGSYMFVLREQTGKIINIQKTIIK